MVLLWFLTYRFFLSCRCPTYNPQPGCTMVADPRDPICCLAPQCPSANITGVTGGITGYGTPPTPTGGVTAVGSEYSTNIIRQNDILISELWGRRWLSGRASDSGARGPGFEPHDRRIVSLNKTL